MVFAVIAATTVAQVASVMGVAVFPVIAPKLALEMDVSPAAIGYQISLVYGTAAVTSPFMSFAVVRWGACRATQVGLTLCAMAMLLALTSSLTAFVAASLLLGLASTLMTPASGHLLFRFSPPEKRNLVFSIKQTGVPLGWVVMALVAPGITLAFGWRWALALVLAVAIGTVAALQPMRARWDDDRRADLAFVAAPAAGLRLLWRHPVLKSLAMASFCLTFVQLCGSAFLVTMLVEEGGYGLVTAGVMLSLMQAAGVAGRLLWGWIADRTGDSVRLLQYIAVTITVCAVIMAFLTPEWPVAALGLLCIVFGLAAVGWNGLFLAEIAHRSPRGMVSVATSAAMMWNFGGILVGPALFAATHYATGSYTQTYGWLGLVAAAGAVLLTAGRRGAPARP
ncbi:MAG TPA: MFS transporter [Burkholderiales bacterium]|nr:MFS transporter [Burkholderiales bacterium]